MTRGRLITFEGGEGAGKSTQVERLAATLVAAGYSVMVSREPGAPHVLHGRITTALESGELERRAGIELSPDRSHLMLCGNPDMIRDLGALLEPRGLKKHRVRRPGHISTEHYW